MVRLHVWVLKRKGRQDDCPPLNVSSDDQSSNPDSHLVSMINTLRFRDVYAFVGWAITHKTVGCNYSYTLNSNGDLTIVIFAIHLLSEKKNRINYLG